MEREILVVMWYLQCDSREIQSESFSFLLGCYLCAFFAFHCREATILRFGPVVKAVGWVEVGEVSLGVLLCVFAALHAKTPRTAKTQTLMRDG
jgi:hypothetical protein